LDFLNFLARPTKRGTIWIEKGGIAMDSGVWLELSAQSRHGVFQLKRIEVACLKTAFHLPSPGGAETTWLDRPDLRGPYRCFRYVVEPDTSVITFIKSASTRVRKSCASSLGSNLPIQSQPQFFFFGSKLAGFAKSFCDEDLSSRAHHALFSFPFHPLLYLISNDRQLCACNCKCQYAVFPHVPGGNDFQLFFE
jgi:hypothetical protein